MIIKVDNKVIYILFKTIIFEWILYSTIYKSKLLCNHIYQYAIFIIIQKLGWDVKSIVLKFPSR